MNFKKSKIRSLVLLALAAVAFCGLIWFANKDRPVYRSSNMAGTDYEVGRVLRVVEDHKTVDEEMDGIWRGSMTLEVEILTGRYKGDTAIVENYFSSLYNVRVAEGDKISGGAGVYRGMYPLDFTAACAEGLLAAGGHYPAHSGLQFCQFLPDRRHLDQDGCGGNRKHAGCACGSSVCTDRAECHVDYDLPDG